MRHETSVKMVNVNKLKGKIVENGMSIENLATVIGVDRATIYRKLNGNGASFSIKEADSICTVRPLFIIFPKTFHYLDVLGTP